MSETGVPRRTLPAVLLLAALTVLAERVFEMRRVFEPDGGFASADIPLPSPRAQSSVSDEDAIANRWSRREFGTDPLTRTELGQLLWAAQGVTDPRTGFRAAPSAGALHPLELIVVTGTPGVEGLEPGAYRYRPEGHTLSPTISGEVQATLRDAALDQEVVETAAIDIVLCAVDERTMEKYGQRGRQCYAPMEAGHAGETLYLQAESLGLAMVSVGAFDDGQLRDILELPATWRPLYVFPVGTRPG